MTESAYVLSEYQEQGSNLAWEWCKVWLAKSPRFAVRWAET